MKLTEHFLKWLAENAEASVSVCVKTYGTVAEPVFREAVTLMLLSGKPHYVDPFNFFGNRMTIRRGSVINYEILDAYVTQTDRMYYATNFDEHSS